MARTAPAPRPARRRPGRGDDVGPSRYISNACRPAPQPCPAPGRRARVQPVEVNGQHLAVLRVLVRRVVPGSLDDVSYAAATAAATARQLNSSSTAAGPAAPIRSRRSGSSSRPGQRDSSSPTSPGATRSAHSPSGPTTSGMAPARETIAASRRPSARGRQREALVTGAARSHLAEPISSTVGLAHAVHELDRVLDRELVDELLVRPPAWGLVTRNSSTSRSVRSFAKPSSRVAIPSSVRLRWPWPGSRPLTRGLIGAGAVVDTSRITCIRAGSTPKSAAMSRLDAADGVQDPPGPTRALPCIRRKPYPRLNVSFRRSSWCRPGRCAGRR